MCESEGVDYQPLVFESFGAMTPAACNLLRCLNRRVADNTNTPIEEVARRFWQRMSIDMQRGMHRAMVRRTGMPQAGGGISRAFRMLQEAALLDEGTRNNA